MNDLNVRMSIELHFNLNKYLVSNPIEITMNFVDR